MNDDIHALIQTFLQARPVTSLLAEDFVAPMGQDEYQKAGIVPFIIEEGQLYFYVMKPTAARPGMPPPKWQLCKGTRMYRSNASGKWKDMRAGEKVDNVDIETLALTALREGNEELGLKPETIVNLFDVGPYRFSSAHTGQDKHMWMFAAELDERDEFLPASHVAVTTADRCWLASDEFKLVGREDHLYILDEIQAKLAKIL